MQHTSKKLIKLHNSFQALAITNENFKEIKVRYFQNKCNNIYNEEIEGSIYAEINNKNDIVLVNLINDSNSSLQTVVN